MPRPPIERSVGGVPRITLFKPAGVPARELEQLRLAVDELEAIRLVDLEGLSHEQAAEALVGGKAILIGGGQYRVESRQVRCFSCHRRWVAGPEAEPATSCPGCGSSDVGVCWGAGDRCGGGRGGGPGRGEHGHGRRGSDARDIDDVQTEEPTNESETP